MACSHSTKPGPCSQCLGVVPRRVTQADGSLYIDGEPAGRPLDIEAQRTDYGRAQQRRKP